ncbi:MAG: DNA recombination protein RmuC [Candidatus Methanoperedens sp.]|nr:DNA recombination protein RmuC [Candidatus Methanoperedens sp.]MCZ7369461.1 DNA recombination protein RmuC [Candidatus Methanoperedens sp.]
MIEIEIILLIIGLIAGFVAGYFYGKAKTYQPADVSAIHGLATQVAEIKTKFVEIEKSRERIEKEREKVSEEKDKRIKEFMDNVHKLFMEQGEKYAKSDEEKEKRIKEMMEQSKKFFEGEKKNTENFLLEQGKSREEIEKKRDAQIADMNRMISSFTKTVSGTKSRGIIGEEILKEVLSNSIKADVVKYNLKTDGGEIEFAWNLEDGKYIPIDSKLPDVFDLLEKYHETEDAKERKDYRKEIIDKTRKEIKRVQKYQNLSNTIDTCLLVVPDGILEIAPELVGMGKEENVFVCTYKDVFPIAHMLHDQYIKLKKEGDIGKYKQLVKVLFQILEKVSKKTETIEKAVTQIQNANTEIKKEVKKCKDTEEDNSDNANTN